jgi:hypothetical protein
MATTTTTTTTKFTNEFRSLMEEFIADLAKTFPDYAFALPCMPISDEEMQKLFEYCLVTYPANFFNILNKNEEIFDDSATEFNTYFLPGCEFRAFYNCAEVTKSTRESIWKYLQLVLFRIVGCLENTQSFGDCLSTLQQLDFEDLKTKMTEVMQNLTKVSHVVDASTDNANGDKNDDDDDDDDDEDDDDDDTDDESDTYSTPFSRKNAEDIHDRMKTLLDGKIGTLAKELAEDVTKSLQEDNLFEDAWNEVSGRDSGSASASSSSSGSASAAGSGDLDPTKILKSLFSNTDKLGSIIQTAGEKLQSKLQSGEIKQEDLFQEATSILGSMKDIPGMGNMKTFMKQFGKMMGGDEMGEAMQSAMAHLGGGGAGGGLGAGMAVNTNAMAQRSAMGLMREKMRARLETKRRAEAEQVVRLAALNAMNMTAGPENGKEEVTPIEAMLLAEETAAAAGAANQKRKPKGGKK